jgi:FAD/FMN-containing dehydrogenase
VWDPVGGRYALKQYVRSDPAIQPLLTSLGRSFVTEVTLQVGANSRLRCESFTDIPISELFAPPSSEGRSFASFVEQSGRAEAIWFPFTSQPWLKVWTVSPVRPPQSREVSGPYNYLFADVIPKSVSDVTKRILDGEVSAAPAFGQLELAVTTDGLLVTDTSDIWGWSKDLLLYVKPTTIRFTANGYAVLTARSNIQQAIYDFTNHFQQLVKAYAMEGDYPINGPVEMRVTGLDHPTDVVGGSMTSPHLSALRPRPDHPEWDVAVWFDVLTMPGTPLAPEFYRELEQWMFSHFSGSYATVRVEWSKGWAYGTTGAWSDPTMLGTTIPDALRTGQAAGDDWDAALLALDAGDPHRVFRNAFLNVFMP